jgi:hypothetical protein
MARDSSFTYKGQVVAFRETLAAAAVPNFRWGAVENTTAKTLTPTTTASPAAVEAICRPSARFGSRPACSWGEADLVEDLCEIVAVWLV